MSKPKLTSLLFLGFIGRIAETLTIAAYNKFFGNKPYQMISFAYNNQKEFYTAFVQTYILAEEATEERYPLTHFFCNSVI